MRTPRLDKLVLMPLLATLLLAEAAAQEPAAEAPQAAGAGEAPQAADEVIVRGRRLEDIEDDLRIYIRDFIGEVVAKPPGRGFARWDRDVCIGVLNLQANAAQYIVDRISSLALDVGLEPGEPGCSPDVSIVFATNAKEMAAQMVENEPRMFMPVGGHAGMDLGRVALQQFVESERAVRWWHVSLPVDARTGGAAIEIDKTCGNPHCPPYIPVAGPSRIHSGTRDELMYVLIIVDATQLKGTTWQQIGDYLAVLSLAQIDPAANPAAFDSILNLFTNPAAYSGLTDWDRTYVRALYEFDQERNPKLQVGELTAEMLRLELGSDE